VKFKDFLIWKNLRKPQDEISDNLESLNSLASQSAFKLYEQIVEWRCHNICETSLFRPHEGTYDQGYIDGMRKILIDFKKIREDYKKKGK